MVYLDKFTVANRAATAGSLLRAVFRKGVCKIQVAQKQSEISLKISVTSIYG